MFYLKNLFQVLASVQWHFTEMWFSTVNPHDVLEGPGRAVLCSFPKCHGLAECREAGADSCEDGGQGTGRQHCMLALPSERAPSQAQRSAEG